MIDIGKIRPKEGWVLVLADPRMDKTASGIYLPGRETGIEKVTEGAGEVIGVGRGKKNHGLGLERGQRVIYRSFLKHANRIPADDTWPNREEKYYFFMSSDDVMGVIAPGVDVGVFSGRPQVQGTK